MLKLNKINGLRSNTIYKLLLRKNFLLCIIVVVFPKLLIYISNIGVNKRLWLFWHIISIRWLVNNRICLNTKTTWSRWIILLTRIILYFKLLLIYKIWLLVLLVTCFCTWSSRCLATIIYCVKIISTNLRRLSFVLCWSQRWTTLIIYLVLLSIFLFLNLVNIRNNVLN